jgi:hypothetical protein
MMKNAAVEIPAVSSKTPTYLKSAFGSRFRGNKRRLSYRNRTSFETEGASPIPLTKWSLRPRGQTIETRHWFIIAQLPKPPSPFNGSLSARAIHNELAITVADWTKAITAGTSVARTKKGMRLAP